VSGAVAQARRDLAGGFRDDLRRIDAQMREARKRLTAAVQASGTTLTEISGAGPVIAAIVIGETGDTGRLAGRDRFAAYNGTAPVEVSSGHRKVHRLSRRGTRRLSHAVHMAAVTQVSQRHSDGRACYDKKVAEGKTAKEALRALKRQVSDEIFKHLKADAARAAAGSGPGGHPGNDSVASTAGLHPVHRLFGQATPGPAPTYDPGHTPLRGRPHPARRKRPAEPLDAKRSRYGRQPASQTVLPLRHRTVVMRSGGLGG
jgi:transposase